MVHRKGRWRVGDDMRSWISGKTWMPVEGEILPPTEIGEPRVKKKEDEISRLAQRMEWRCS